MSTKPLERLLFIQGGRCFFCNHPLPPDEASVEHLLAKSNGGGNEADNCVACCKAINSVLGSMSLRDKFQVVLNQKGQFKCPAKAEPGKIAPVPKNQPVPLAKAPAGDARLALIIANLKQRGNSRPGSLKTLKTSIANLFPKSLKPVELDALIEQLQTSGKLRLQENKIIYTL